MSNEYFDNTQNRIANGTTARAPDVNNVIDATAAAFDLLPDPQSIWGDRETVGLCGGTANAILLTIGGQTPIPYQDGQGAIFQKLNGNNTGACTLAIDAGSPKPLVNFNEEELVAGDLVNRRWYHVRYDAADDRWMIVNQITVGALDAAVASAASSATDALNYASSASAASIAAWNQKGYAEEWAQAAEDTPVSVAAGGDGATDFSARHWAAKAADTVDGAVIKAATGPQAIYGAAGVSDALGADDGSLTISTGDSGVTSFNLGYDDLIIESDAGANGITIASRNTGFGGLHFADPEDPDAGAINYSHSADAMVFKVANTNALRLNSSTGNYFGDGPDLLGAEFGSLTISTGDSAVTSPSANADELLIESDGNAGLTIASPNTALGQIRFADPESSNAGAMKYDHTGNYLGFVSNGTDVGRFDALGRFIMTGSGTTSDALGAESGSVTISTGDSGETSPNANADELLIEGSGNTGMTVYVPDSVGAQARIALGSPTKQQGGGIRYYPDDDMVRIGGLGVTGTEVAIDVENGGQAILIDTDKIAHFTGVAKVNMIHMYKTSDVALTGSFADVTWNTEVYKNEAVYSHPANAAYVAADVDGWYKVTVVLSSYNDLGGAGDRCGAFYKLQADTTGSYVDVPGTLVASYNRDVDTGYGSTTIVSILQLSATDTVKVVAQQYDGTDTVYLDADGCTFTMERVA